MAAKRRPERESWPTGLMEPRPGYFAMRFGEGSTRALGRMTYEEALVARAEMLDRYKGAQVFEQLAAENRAAVRMRDHTYYRAAARARKFDRALMSREEFDAMWVRAGGKCELTGITFTLKPEDSGEVVWPWHSSLDRIDSDKGYEFSNCRIVCVAVNLALQGFGESVFSIVARCFVSRSSAQKSIPDRYGVAALIGEEATGR